MGLLTGLIGLALGGGGGSGSSSSSGSSSRRKRYQVYCKYCGRSKSSNGYGYDTPAQAIQELQRENDVCGRNCHEPVVEEM